MPQLPITPPHSSGHTRPPWSRSKLHHHTKTTINNNRYIQLSTPRRPSKVSSPQRATKKLINTGQTTSLASTSNQTTNSKQPQKISNKPSMPLRLPSSQHRRESPPANNPSQISVSRSKVYFIFFAVMTNISSSSLTKVWGPPSSTVLFILNEAAASI